MLSDGDSVAHAAIVAAQPYGPDRLVQKFECVNHFHKRFGTSLRNLAKEAHLGGRGEGRLTLDKCVRLQHYFRGAVLNNKPSCEDVRAAIWATLFHVTSTDEDPHHTRCPDGAESWCFYKRAQALGQAPASHSQMKTALSREVAAKLLPVYHRFSSRNLLGRVMHGKTQNNNESLHGLIWSHCPKTVFVGATRLQAAVGEAISKFNRGNSHLADVMESLQLQANQHTMTLLGEADALRVKKAEKASVPAYVAARQARHLQQRQQLAAQEEAEGETYGPGLARDN